MGECQIIDTVPPNRTYLEFLPGPYLGGRTEVNELFDPSPETSSEGSENENNLLDAQQWENVSLAPVDQFATSAGSNGSDYIWIEESEESQAVQPKAQVDALNAVASQWIQDDNNPKARGSTRQKSRRPFQDQHLRTETSNTRKLKACVRCRMQKVRVRVLRSVRIYNRAYCHSVELMRTIRTVYVRPAKQFPNNEFTLFLVPDTRSRNAHCTEPENLQAWSLPSDGQ
jgi:hypothetical protein